MLQQLITCTRGRKLALSLAVLGLVLFLPAGPALAQDMLVDESGAADAVEDEASAENFQNTSYQRFEVYVVGTLQAGGTGHSDLPGTVTITLASQTGGESKTLVYDIGPSGGAGQDYKQRIREWITRSSGQRAVLRGHLHGRSRGGRPYMHLETAMLVPSTFAFSLMPDQLGVSRLVGRVIDNSAGAITQYAVEAAHRGGYPIRFNIKLLNLQTRESSSAFGGRKIEIRNGGVGVFSAWRVEAQFILSLLEWRFVD